LPATTRLTRRLERAFLAASRRAAAASDSPTAAWASAVADTARKFCYDHVVTVNSVTGSVSPFGLTNLLLHPTARDMWSVVDRLLERGRRACDGVSAEDLSAFFR